MKLFEKEQPITITPKRLVPVNHERALLIDVLKDERISESIRLEYANKLIENIYKPQTTSPPSINTLVR